MSPVTSLILDSPLAVALPSLFLPSLLNGSRASAKHLRLPPFKLHYSMLAEDAIKSAVKNYKKNKAFSDPARIIIYLHLYKVSDFPPWTVLSGGCWPALRFWDSGNIKKNEEFMEIEKKELASIGDLHTYLSKLTDKLGSCSDYGLYTDFEKMAGIQKKEGVGCRSSHLHIQGQ
ncbi:hypothetical protein YC2023_015607 [Brassica napus]|uniref:(rape) hypothetical protein n=1 Tax=Brassica napus TaxID=3708 RepID=A0A816K3I6_BRANA|nr:unnamed protein product [Brassica napus]